MLLQLQWEDKEEFRKIDTNVIHLMPASKVFSWVILSVVI